MRNLCHSFVLCTASQIIDGDFVKFVALSEFMNFTNVNLIIQEVKKCKVNLLCVSVSQWEVNLRGLRGSLKQKNPALEAAKKTRKMWNASKDLTVL